MGVGRSPQFPRIIGNLIADDLDVAYPHTGTSQVTVLALEISMKILPTLTQAYPAPFILGSTQQPHDCPFSRGMKLASRNLLHSPWLSAVCNRRTCRHSIISEAANAAAPTRVAQCGLCTRFAEAKAVPFLGPITSNQPRTRPARVGESGLPSARVTIRRLTESV